MTTAAVPTEVVEELYAPLGAPGSGRRRYAAAMALRQSGHLSDLALEAFRVCSPIDHEDPLGLLAAWRVEHEMPPRPARSAQTLVAGLLAEILSAEDFFVPGADREIRGCLAAVAMQAPLLAAGTGSSDAGDWPHERLQTLCAGPGLATEVRRQLALTGSLIWLPVSPSVGGNRSQMVTVIAAPHGAPCRLPDATFGFSVGMPEPGGPPKDAAQGNFSRQASSRARYRTLARAPGDELGWWFSPSA